MKRAIQRLGDAERALLDRLEQASWSTWRTRALIYGLPAIVVLVLLGWLFDNTDEVRNVMLTFGVLGAGVGVWVAFRRSETDRRRAETDRLRQVTETFEGAVTLLGHEDRSVRLGAIYALERIARQNEEEHWPIMETLAAYVREWSEHRKRETLVASEIASALGSGKMIEEDKEAEAIQKNRIVVQEPAAADAVAVFTVLGRRRVDHEDPTRRLNLRDAYLVSATPDPTPNRQFARVDLRGADLRGADLRGADLRGADLRGADLEGADLEGADLEQASLERANCEGANLERANLERANLEQASLERAKLDQARLLKADLSEANLSGAELLLAALEQAFLFEANLERANLSGANLSGADLYGANFEGANLELVDLLGANLSRANLSGVDLSRVKLSGVNLARSRGLMQLQLERATGDETTKIPEGLTRPAHWSK